MFILRDILPLPEGRGFGLFLPVTLVAEARLVRNLPGSDAAPPRTCPLCRGISCTAGGGIMGGDVALPPNDWCYSAPVGHTCGKDKKCFKHHDSSSAFSRGVIVLASGDSSPPEGRGLHQQG